jgi:NAD-dependent dihydropyrimidine dehydrogenase PreA subunit
MAKQAKHGETVYYPEIATAECKGCGRCVQSCPENVLYLGKDLNSLGYPAVKYRGCGCRGCGICFYNCPEPGTLTIIEETSDPAKREAK